MKLKYYLRGLGIGIVVTALILMISEKTRNHISDKEIIERAERLGMVMQESENDTLFPEKSQNDETTVFETDASAEKMTSEEESKSQTETVSDSEAETFSATETDSEAETFSETETDSATETVTGTEAPVEYETPAKQVEIYTLTITDGMYSEAVSSRLAEAGMVESAADFNGYLERNGYAERIRAGVYNITAGMSYDDIAAMIIQ